MNSLLYYHVSGRPPTARTDITDRNVIFFLEHQLRWDPPRIQQFMQELPPNTNEPQQPWGSQMIHLGEQEEHIDEQPFDDNNAPQPPPDDVQHPPFDDPAAGEDDGIFPPQPPPSESDDDDSDSEYEAPPPPPAQEAPARRRNNRPRGPTRYSERIRRRQRNERTAKKKAIEKMRTKRSGLLYKLLFGR